MIYIGVDPGINVVCLAMINRGKIYCHAIRNKSKRKAWKKLEDFLLEMDAELFALLSYGYGKWGDVIYEVPQKVRAVAEGQYPARIGSPDHQTRNGWVASAAYMHLMALPKVKLGIAEVGVWTKGEKKEERHKRIEKFYEESEVIWTSKELPKGLMHNQLDSIGLALYAKEQHEKGM